MKIGAIYDEAAGRRSRSALVAMGAFWAGLAKFILSGAELKVWGCHIHFAPVDAGLLVAFMGPCFALYWGRRYTDEAVKFRGVGAGLPGPLPPGPPPGIAGTGARPVG